MAAWHARAASSRSPARRRPSPGTLDAAVTPQRRFVYVQTGGNGVVDEFAVGSGGSLTEIGHATVASAVGGEGWQLLGVVSSDVGEYMF